MHVKTMRTLAPDKGTVITGQFAIGTTSFKGISAYATRAVIGAPSPCCHAKPTVYLKAEFGKRRYPPSFLTVFRCTHRLGYEHHLQC